MRVWLVVAMLAAGALPAAARAQSSNPGTVVVGLVVDSIRGRVLSGAFVRVAGTSLNGVADSAGRFIIPGVPAGDQRFEVFHPFLDTLRLALRTDVRRSTGRDSMLVIV